MGKKMAKIISVAGHPFFTIPLFVTIVLFSYEDFKQASWICFLIIGCIFLPLSVRMFIKSKNGSYTNFDVSDRIQRNSLFRLAVPLLIAVTVILHITGQPEHIIVSVLFASVLVFISQIVNFFIKSSLHVSLNIYLSFLAFTVHQTTGIVLFLLTFLIGWSRIELDRHTKKEVLYGAVIGLVTSITMLYIEGI